MIFLLYLFAMKTSIPLFTKIAARSFMAWISIVIPGIIISIIGLIVAIYIISHQPGPGFTGARAGGIGAILAIFVLFTVAFWSTTLLVYSIAGFILFPSLASGYTLRKALFLCWDNKLGDFFISKIDGYVERILQRGDALKTNIKKELKIEVKQDHDTNKLQKRLLNFLLKKVSLDNIDWQAPQPKIKQEILARIKAYIGEKLTPSPLMIRLAMVLPVVLMILAFIYDK